MRRQEAHLIVDTPAIFGGSAVDMANAKVVYIDFDDSNIRQQVTKKQYEYVFENEVEPNMICCGYFGYKLIVADVSTDHHTHYPDSYLGMVIVYVPELDSDSGKVCIKIGRCDTAHKQFTRELRNRYRKGLKI